MSDAFEDERRRASRRARKGDESGAWSALTPLLRGRSDDVRAARSLGRALGDPNLERTRRLVVAEELLARWPDDPEVLCALGSATPTLVDGRWPNAAPPESVLFRGVVRRLEAALDAAVSDDSRVDVAFALATAARVAGRRFDDAAESAHHTLLALRPAEWTHHFNYGTFLKSRGRYEQGTWANRRAAELGGRGDEAVTWNLGICATACGQGSLALGLWRSLGMAVELGEDGLPYGSFEQVQVRIARRTLAERTAEEDDPGEEETVWVDRLSPCHGRIRSATVQDLGVDHEDVVLFDGAPIIMKNQGNRDVPVFPHLSTLRRTGWQILRFAGTEMRPGELVRLGRELAAGADVAVHRGAVAHLCGACWALDDEFVHTDATARIVMGKLCIPPGVLLVEVAERVEALPPGLLRVAVPELFERLADAPRAARDRARYALLERRSAAASAD